MRHKSKTCSLEAKFPLLAVEQGCLISKDADITVAFRVELPELFTVTSAEYEAMHSAWHKAIKVLPNFSIVHKQLYQGFFTVFSTLVLSELGRIVCSNLSKVSAASDLIGAEKNIKSAAKAMRISAPPNDTSAS